MKMNTTADRPKFEDINSEKDQHIRSHENLKHQSLTQRNSSHLLKTVKIKEKRGRPKVNKRNNSKMQHLSSKLGFASQVATNIEYSLTFANQSFLLPKINRKVY